MQRKYVYLLLARKQSRKGCIILIIPNTFFHFSFIFVDIEAFDINISLKLLWNKPFCAMSIFFLYLEAIQVRRSQSPTCRLVGGTTIACSWVLCFYTAAAVPETASTSRLGRSATKSLSSMILRCYYTTNSLFVLGLWIINPSDDALGLSHLDFSYIYKYTY